MKVFYTTSLLILLLAAPKLSWSRIPIQPACLQEAKTVNYTRVDLVCSPADDTRQGTRQCKYGSFQLTVDYANPQKLFTIANGKATQSFTDLLGDGTELSFQLFTASESFVLLVVKTHEFNSDVRIFEAIGNTIVEYRSFGFEGPGENNEKIRYEVSKNGGILLVKKQTEEFLELEPVENGSTGKKNPQKQLPAPLSGEWQPGCTDPLGNFRVDGKKAVIDIVVKQAGVLSAKLEIAANPANGEYLLYYRGIEAFVWPLGTEEYADYPLSEADISQEVPVGKLIPADEKHMDLVWFGLYHKPLGTAIFSGDLYYSPDSEGKITLQHCP